MIMMLSSNNIKTALKQEESMVKKMDRNHNQRNTNYSANNKQLIMNCILITIMIVYFTTTATMVDAYPTNLMMTRKYPVNVEVENPEELISTLDNLIQNILVGIDSLHLSNSNNNNIQQLNDNNKSMITNKRGIDLGLSRGFSGSQAAKHLMGMSAASFANGPGRRR